MKLSHLLTVLAGVSTLVLPLSAQIFVGSDNFNDNTLTIQNTGFVNGVAGSGPLNQAAGQWRVSSPSAGGAFTETNSRMEFTNSTTTGTNYSSLTWASPSFSINSAPSGLNLGLGGTGLSSGAPYTSSWSAQLAITNTTTPAAGYTLAGMEIYGLTTTATSNAYYGIYLSNSFSGGNRLQVEWGIYNVGISDFTRTTSFLNIGDTTDVTVRAAFDNTSKIMSFDYATDGVTFLSTGISYDLDGAQMGLTAPLNNGLGLSLIGFSNGGAGAIAAGTMYYDNLNVSAIPEPSTYAAFAGLGALGLAAWRRRQKTAAAA